MENIPGGTIGNVTLTRTYARRANPHDPASRVESWSEIVERVLHACDVQLNCKFTSDEVAEFRGLLLKMKGMVGGRFLWQLGTKTVDEIGLMSLQNCAAVDVVNTRAFTWAMDALMLGCGVGFLLTKENMTKFPKVRHVEVNRDDVKDATFIVPDSREGWIALVDAVLRAHFETGKKLAYSCQLVRKRGEPIAKFGGTASGPEVLEEGVQSINKILNAVALQHNGTLRTIDALDIMNNIGKIVVAGNVRRSAQIALGHVEDTDFLNAKDWSSGMLPDTRAFSNNSVICNDISKLPERYWDYMNGNAEPLGLINIDLMRSCGRSGDLTRKDPKVTIINPCAEICLQGIVEEFPGEGGETCCLADIPISLLDSFEEFKRVIYFLYRVCKQSLTLKCHHRGTESIVHTNFRIGLGLTGILEASNEQLSWMSPGYEYLDKLDIEYSKANGLPRSIKLTTVKPSGTLSLLAGVTSGAHPEYAQYYIRRIRFAADSPLLPDLEKAGYEIEYQRKFGSKELDLTTKIVSFPKKAKPTARMAKDMTAIDQLEVIARLQREWSDNAVSVTIYYGKEELPAIKAWLSKNYNTQIKSVSWLLRSEHGFDQAPLEEINEETYNKMCANIRPISEFTIQKHRGVEQSEQDADFLQTCDRNGMCPVR